MLIALLSAGNFVIGMGAFVVVGLVGPISRDLEVSASAAGGLLTIYAIAYAIGSPLLVASTGGRSRRAVLALGMGTFAAAAAISALAPGMGLLAAARVLAAFGAGLFTPTTAAVAASIASGSGQGRALARVFFGLTLAQVLGVPTGAWLAYVAGWQASFAVVAVLSLPILVGVLRLVPADLPFRPTSLASLGAALADVRGMLAVAFTGAFLGAIYVVYTYLDPLLSQSMSWGRDGISAALLVFGVGAVVGNLLGGRMADALGAQRTLRILVLCQIGLMPVFSMLPLPGPAVMILLLAWSMAGWSFVAPQQMRLIALSPERQNLILALNAAAIYVGAAVGSGIGGVVIATLGVNALGLAAGLCGISAFALLRMRGRPRPA